MIRNIIFMMTVIFLLCHLSASESLAQMNVKRQIKKGNLFYDKKQYEQALKEYNQALSADSESLIVNYNMGTALYKLEDYEIAKDHFRHGITSQDKQLAQKSFYNLANTQYYLGISKEDSSLPDAIRLLEESLRYYENAIMIDNKDEDAKYNYDNALIQLSKLKITASFDGVITGLQYYTEGIKVASGSEMVHLMNYKKLTMDVKLPGKYLGLIKNNKKARVMNYTLPDEIFYGNIYYINKILIK